jgi:hypothetical protein
VNVCSEGHWWQNMQGEAVLISYSRCKLYSTINKWSLCSRISYAHCIYAAFNYCTSLDLSKIAHSN